MENKLTIQYISLDSINEYSNNAKVHSDKQLAQIKKSIEEFGYLNPILLDKNKFIIAGHGRYQALKALGKNTAPCLYASHLNKAQIRAYRIADNKLSENASWDPSLLSIELEYLQDLDMHYDFDTLGFDSIEIDTVLHHASKDSGNEDIEYLPELSKSPTSRAGDIFHCGPHRVGCGDCRDETFMRKLMKRSKASICVTDPPYNVPISGHVRGKGKDQFSEFAMASGEMSSDEFTQFLSLSFLNLKRFSRDGSLFYIFCDWRHLTELFSATEELFSDMLNLCVWNKSNGGMGSLYRSKHELIGVFKQGKAPHINNVQLGKYGRDRCNVWDYPGLSSFSKNRDEELSIHATPKPVSMLKDILLDASKPNDIVVDGFLGSGSTLIAAEKVRRRCFGVEIDPHYVDVTLQRWMLYTGEEPVHIESGLKFTELSAQRKREQEVA